MPAAVQPDLQMPRSIDYNEPQTGNPPSRIQPQLESIAPARLAPVVVDSTPSKVPNFALTNLFANQQPPGTQQPQPGTQGPGAVPPQGTRQPAFSHLGTSATGAQSFADFKAEDMASWSNKWDYDTISAHLAGIEAYLDKVDKAHDGLDKTREMLSEPIVRMKNSFDPLRKFIQWYLDFHFQLPMNHDLHIGWEQVMYMYAYGQDDGYDRYINMIDFQEDVLGTWFGSGPMKAGATQPTTMGDNPYPGHTAPIQTTPISHNIVGDANHPRLIVWGSPMFLFQYNHRFQWSLARTEFWAYGSNCPSRIQPQWNGMAYGTGSVSIQYACAEGWVCKKCLNQAHAYASHLIAHQKTWGMRQGCSHERYALLILLVRAALCQAKARQYLGFYAYWTQRFSDTGPPMMYFPNTRNPINAQKPNAAHNGYMGGMGGDHDEALGRKTNPPKLLETNPPGLWSNPGNPSPVKACYDLLLGVHLRNLIADNYNFGDSEELWTHCLVVHDMIRARNGFQVLVGRFIKALSVKMVYWTGARVSIQPHSNFYTLSPDQILTQNFIDKTMQLMESYEWVAEQMDEDSPLDNLICGPNEVREVFHRFDWITIVGDNCQRRNFYHESNGRYVKNFQMQRKDVLHGISIVTRSLGKHLKNCKPQTSTFILNELHPLAKHIRDLSRLEASSPPIFRYLNMFYMKLVYLNQVLSPGRVNARAMGDKLGRSDGCPMDVRIPVRRGESMVLELDTIVDKVLKQIVYKIWKRAILDGFEMDAIGYLSSFDELRALYAGSTQEIQDSMEVVLHMGHSAMPFVIMAIDNMTQPVASGFRVPFANIRLVLQDQACNMNLLAWTMRETWHADTNPFLPTLIAMGLTPDLLNGMWETGITGTDGFNAVTMLKDSYYSTTVPGTSSFAIDQFLIGDIAGFLGGTMNNRSSLTGLTEDDAKERLLNIVASRAADDSLAEELVFDSAYFEEGKERKIVAENEISCRRNRRRSFWWEMEAQIQNCTALDKDLDFIGDSTYVYMNMISARQFDDFDDIGIPNMWADEKKNVTEQEYAESIMALRRSTARVEYFALAASDLPGSHMSLDGAPQKRKQWMNEGKPRPLARRNTRGERLLSKDYLTMRAAYTRMQREKVRAMRKVKEAARSETR